MQHKSFESNIKEKLCYHCCYWVCIQLCLYFIKIFRLRSVREGGKKSMDLTRLIDFKVPLKSGVCEAWNSPVIYLFFCTHTNLLTHTPPLIQPFAHNVIFFSLLFTLRGILFHQNLPSSSSDVFWQLAAESTENVRRSCIASLWIWRKHTVPREEVWHCMRKSGVAETGARYVWGQCDSGKVWRSDWWFQDGGGITSRIGVEPSLDCTGTWQVDKRDQPGVSWTMMVMDDCDL